MQSSSPWRLESEKGSLREIQRLLLVVSTLNEDVYDNVAFGLIIEDTKSMAANLTKFQFQHVTRRANSVAHVLARHAQFYRDLEVWMESVPPNF